jgi:hypothetical protein
MIDRRHSNRFEIPGARVYYQGEDGLKTETKLNNLTHGGARFRTGRKLNKGEVIELEIQLPERERILVKGYVVWTSEMDAAIRFLAFGKKDSFNSFQSYQQLKLLINECYPAAS